MHFMRVILQKESLNLDLWIKSYDIMNIQVIFLQLPFLFKLTDFSVDKVLDKAVMWHLLIGLCDSNK